MNNNNSQKEIKRIALLIQLFDLFHNEYVNRLHPQEELHINYVQLYNVVASYFQDVDRYKQYHFRDPAKSLVNDAKKCAFTLKWLSRIKPLYIHNSFSLDHSDLDTFDYDDPSMIVNEWFSVFVAECLLGIGFSTTKFSEILYLLRYRNPDEYALIPLFQVLMDLRDGETIVIR